MGTCVVYHGTDYIFIGSGTLNLPFKLSVMVNKHNNLVKLSEHASPRLPHCMFHGSPLPLHCLVCSPTAFA